MKKAALPFILITVVLDMMALGIIIPVLPKLILQFQGGDSANAAKIYGLFGVVFAAIQFLFAPFLGALSDRIGRRPIILLSNLGLGLDYVLMALSPNLVWLFVGRVVAALCCSSFTIPGAYIADVTAPEKRAAGFGLMGAAFGLGFILGPSLGGILGSVDPRLPFWVSAALSLANFLYGVIVLPESLPKGLRTPIEWKKANPVGSLDLIKRHPETIGLTAVIFLSYLAHESLPSLWVLYTDYRYGWNERMVGYTLGAVGVGSAVVMGGLVGPAVKRFGERSIFILGLAFGTIGFALYGIARTEPWFWLGIPFGSLWGLAGPTTQALMSRGMDPTEQGRLQGALGALRGITGMIGPGLFTLVYAWSISPARESKLPGSGYLMAAGFLALSTILSLVVTREAVAKNK